jgi:hypothetical protein
LAREPLFAGDPERLEKIANQIEQMAALIEAEGENESPALNAAS